MSLCFITAFINDKKPTKPDRQPLMPQNCTHVQCAFNTTVSNGDQVCPHVVKSLKYFTNITLKTKLCCSQFIFQCEVLNKISFNVLYVCLRKRLDRATVALFNTHNVAILERHYPRENTSERQCTRGNVHSLKYPYMLAGLASSCWHSMPAPSLELKRLHK